MKPIHCLARTGLLLVAAIALPATHADQAIDPLESGFRAPPAAAQPRVWWHWMNGNISEPGIERDLAWMHAVGIGGITTIDASIDTPQVVKERLPYMTPAWQHAFALATRLTRQYGMEGTIASSPGWNETGGPWVPAAEAMKKYVWSESEVAGGTHYHGVLPSPPRNTGAFQDMGIRDAPLPPGTPPIPAYYADARVFAWHEPASLAGTALPAASITSSNPALDASVVSDGHYDRATTLPIPLDGQAWINFRFEQPQTIRGITYALLEPAEHQPSYKLLEASDDGEHYRTVARLDAGKTGVTLGNAPLHTIAFLPVTAKYFRLSIQRVAPDGSDGIKASESENTSCQVFEVALRREPTIQHFEEKVGFGTERDLSRYPTPGYATKDVVAPGDVIDLTSKMASDGTLDWVAPPGKWKVVRLGYSLMGISNHPSTAEASGLEVDKFDRRFTRHYLEHYLQSYRDAVGADLIGERGITHMLNDSWEVGTQTWTDHMLERFRELRGYDASPWLPVLVDQVVGSPQASERFLWDYRKTLADLVAVEHYEATAQILHEWHMQHYGEAHEVTRVYVADGMQVKKSSEIPMSAMWTGKPHVNGAHTGYVADDRESASVAHIYGKNIAAAESLTAAEAPWGWSPATLKPTADLEFINGINRIVIHESAHQPQTGPHDVPGITLGPYGQWFNRNETWANDAGPWISYLARTSYMLQQGRFTADVLYYYGEDSNITALFDDTPPVIPAGFDFDYVNADALINELKASPGDLHVRSGMHYRVLVLDAHARQMSLPVLKAIHQLVTDGATVAGAKPVFDPSLADDQAAFAKLATELFGDGTGEHHAGKGVVYAGMDAPTAIGKLKLAPDFDYNRATDGGKVAFLHRTLTNGDIYFLDNRSDAPVTIDAIFRVAGRSPGLWRAETGDKVSASFTVADGRTHVPVTLEPWGTVFVVVREPTTERRRVVPANRVADSQALNGPWQVAFASGWGAQAKTRLPALASWTQSSDPGIRYFSGTATYTRNLDIPAHWVGQGQRIVLDLGDVRELAHVVINGQDLGVSWHAPFTVDVTQAIKAGKNNVELRITNLWVNRLIGDEQPGAKRMTYADIHPYKANTPLLDSGLLGPVTLKLMNASGVLGQ